MGCITSINEYYDNLEKYLQKYLYEKYDKPISKRKEYYTIKGDNDNEPIFQFIDITNDYSDI